MYGGKDKYIYYECDQFSVRILSVRYMKGHENYPKL